MINLERPINSIQDVTTHVAKRTVPEVVPAVPLVRVDIGMKVTIRRGTNPFVPVKPRRDRNRRWTRTHSSVGAVGPTMSFSDISHDAVPHKFAQPAIAVFAMALVAHLRRGFGLTRHFPDFAGFGDI